MTDLNIIDGLRFWSKKFDASSLSVFWYPCPAPRVIVPFSRNGPQSVPSGLDRGICVNNTVGLSIFSKRSSSVLNSQKSIGPKRNQELTRRELSNEIHSTSRHRAPPTLSALPNSTIRIPMPHPLPVLLNQPRSINEQHTMVRNRYSVVEWSEVGFVASCGIWGEGGRGA
jgi:hypothetical protein